MIQVLSIGTREIEPRVVGALTTDSWSIWNHWGAGNRIFEGDDEITQAKGTGDPQRIK